MVGDPNTGFLVGQSQTFPDGTVKYSEYRIGGTSLSCPLFAGVVAVADQVHGGSLGFLNPQLYSLAGTSAFRDVNHGRKVTDGVVRVDYVNGFDAKDGTDHVAAHAEPDRHDLHPQGLRRRHRRRQPQRRELLHRGRGRADAPLTPTASGTGAPGQRTAACVTTRIAPHGLSRSGRGTPTTATRSPRCSVRAGAPVRTKRRFAVCRTTHWGRSPSIT